LEITNQSPGPLPSLLLPPARGSCSVPLCRWQRCTSSRRFTAAAGPPPAEIFSTRRLLPLPVQFLSPGGLPRARHGYPERPPAATSSSSWRTHHRALTFGLSRATASRQPLRPIAPVPEPICEHPTHISPPPSSSAPATHGTPVGSHNQTSSTPNQPLCKLSRSSVVLINHQLSSNCNRSSTSDERHRRRPRPHCGQLAPGTPAPPQPPSQHHIILVKLHDLSISSLVQHIEPPTIAGIHPRRRRHCSSRLPPIRCVSFQLIVPTRSPCLTEARAQVCCQRRSPEHRRRR
jgi:hypothetical protein